jgi:hypothetical protein
MKRMFVLCALVLLVFTAGATTYYVSYANGNDTYTGTTVGAPFKTLTKAIAVAAAGDVIYVRGGTHVYTSRINFTKSGTASNRISIIGYPGDARPLFDFSGMAVNSSNRGFEIGGSYWYIKGIDIYKAGDNGMHINGSYNIIEFCTFSENADTGLQIDGGGAYNQIINCDSYYNVDASQGNADGFAVKLEVGTGNSFKGCRAWQNSDDGWDGLLSTGSGLNPSTTYDSCWCFMNGYLKSGSASSGNGNGFKMGGNNELHDATLTRCLSVYNRKKGFDQNNNNGSMILYNCTGYKNGPNYGMSNNNPSTGKVMILKNCVSYSSASSSNSFASQAQISNCSWQSPFSSGLNNADFVSLDSTGLTAARKADGSLPDINFMHLAQGSDLIDGGVNVSLPYYGAAPDLGAFETNYTTSPVSLLAFNGKLQKNNVLLNWVTATEINNKGWNIERSITLNGTTSAFKSMGFVAGNGNTNTEKTYSFTDENVPANAVLQYRLQQTDVDGHITYSGIVALQSNGKTVTAIHAYPNPVHDKLAIAYTLADKTTARVDVYDATGKMVYSLPAETLDAGSYTRNLDMEKLAAGLYTLVLTTANESLPTPFIKH